MESNARRVVLLGSTGSIGTQTLDVIDRLNQRGLTFLVVGLAAGKQIDRLTEQIERYHPLAVSVSDEKAREVLQRRFPTLWVLAGEEGLRELSRLDGVDLIVNALVGAIGLFPTLEGLSQGRTVALANKESLVVGGELVVGHLRQYGGTILPLDSEHNALFQCIQAGRLCDVHRVVLTASGGPFLRTPKEDLRRIQPEEALRHPNWVMGKRITIDSATMVNKGFEVIEAHYLFALPYEKIKAVIHPESVVHSFVEYEDGSILAQLSAPDMRIPIQYALTHPERLETGLLRLKFEAMRQMSFEPLDPGRFPAFALVLEAAQQGGSAPAAINAADEVLVERFLHGEIPFTGIAAGLDAVLSDWMSQPGHEGPPTLFELRAVDDWARDIARALHF